MKFANLLPAKPIPSILYDHNTGKGLGNGWPLY